MDGCPWLGKHNSESSVDFLSHTASGLGKGTCVCAIQKWVTEMDSAERGTGETKTVLRSKTLDSNFATTELV